MKDLFITSRILSEKCKYALRALFELASRNDNDAVKISEIANKQAISIRFLENIMVELKQAGFVVSKRGNEGGYNLLRPAEDLTIGEIIAFMQGVKQNKELCNHEMVRNGDYAFSNLWQRLNDLISDLYNSTTLADLVQEEAKAAKNYVPNYII